MRGEANVRATMNTGWRAMARTVILFAVLAASAYASVAAAAVSPVYRFYNERTGTHFYTISAAERDKVLANYPWFDYEGPVFYASTTQDADTLPVYRFYNNSTGTHFYTISETEKQHVIDTYPVFVYEGPVYYAPPGSGTGRTALFRFFNTKTGAHFYTTNADERDHVLATWPWFAYEGTAFFVFPSSGAPGPGLDQAPKAVLSSSTTSVSVPGSLMLTVDAGRLLPGTDAARQRNLAAIHHRIQRHRRGQLHVQRDRVRQRRDGGCVQ
jgi:hypothetical protein